jgi:hypothetical protein
MRALLALLFLTGTAQADAVTRCAFSYPLQGEDCENFERTAQALLTSLRPPGLSITEIKQSAATFFLYVEPTGPVTGGEGAVMTETLCALPDLRGFLDGNYNMSVRMTTKAGDTTVLDEIAFIQDCEAN